MKFALGFLLFLFLADQEVEIIPAGWRSQSDPALYETGLDHSLTHSGKVSGSIKSKGKADAGFGNYMQSISAKNYLGKTVKYSAYIKSKDVTGWSGMWIRVDKNSRKYSAFDNMNDRPIKGTTDWTKYETVVDVAEDSRNISFGILLNGEGAVWIDDIKLEVVPSVAKNAKPSSASVDGKVTDSSGNPVPGAIIAAVSPLLEEAQETTRTDHTGSFHFESLPFDSYAFTATVRGMESAFSEPKGIKSANVTVNLQLKNGGKTISGRITDVEGNALSGVQVIAFRNSRQEGDVFYAESDRIGFYALTLPNDFKYLLTAKSPNFQESKNYFQLENDINIDFQLEKEKRDPPSAEVMKWIRSQAIPLATAEPRADLSDMDSLRGIVGKARVVCLGEATHGTREFFQLKHRMLQFLVERMGFDVFGIEATMPEAYKVNKYVLTGEGDPAEALAGLYFWTWNTKEVLEMIEWMRTYNADPAHTRKVKFYGFDMQSPQNAIKVTSEYLAKVDPSLQKDWDQSFPENPESAIDEMELSQLTALRSKTERFLNTLDERKKKYAEQSGEAEWAFARQHARIVLQSIDQTIGYHTDDYSPRDRSMAENILWILEQEGPDARMVAWAHNGHVSRNPQDRYLGNPMGWHLKKALNDDVVIFGFSFNQGSFQAIDGSINKEGLRNFRVRPATAGSIDEGLAKSGLKIAALDLRETSKNDAAKSWFSVKRKSRSLGALYDESHPELFYDNSEITKMYDALLFVENTSAAIPVKRKQDAKKYVFSSDSPANLDFEQ